MKEQEDSKKIRRMGLGMQVLAWLTFLGLGVFYFGDVLEKQHNPNQHGSQNPHHQSLAQTQRSASGPLITHRAPMEPMGTDK